VPSRARGVRTLTGESTMRKPFKHFVSAPDALPKGSVAVVIYVSQRCYGGPEEGGWWYTDSVVDSVAIFRSMRKARLCLKEVEPLLNRKYRELESADANYNDWCLAQADRLGLDPDSIGSLDYCHGIFAQLEFPGECPISEPDQDGRIRRLRPRNLRTVYCNEERLYTPHYC